MPDNTNVLPPLTNEVSSIEVTPGRTTTRTAAVPMQARKMHYENRNGNHRYNVVQAKETSNSVVSNVKATPDICDYIWTDLRKDRKQVSNDSESPERHGTPRQNITHKCDRHHQNKYDNASPPDRILHP